MKKFIALALTTLILASCSTTNEVTSNRLFQKRKYQKGWHVNSSRSVDKSTKSTDDEVVASYTINETISEEQLKETQSSSLTSPQLAESNENSIAAQAESVVENPEKVVSKVNNILEKQRQSTTNSLSENVVPESEFQNTTVSRDQSIRKLISEKSKDSSGDDMLILLYILAVLIPFVAVGIVTDWDLKKVLINILLCILCYIPGVIHAFITIRDYYR